MPTKTGFYSIADLSPAPNIDMTSNSMQVTSTSAESTESGNVMDNTSSPYTESDNVGLDGLTKKDDPIQGQDSFAGGRRRSIAPQEAIRRGLSFGPIKKTGSTQNTALGILKAKSKSPSSRLSQRSLSSTNDPLSSTELGDLKKDYDPSDGNREGVVESSDEDDPIESSGDERSPLGRLRGRDRGGGSEERTPPKSPLATSPEISAVIITPAEGELQRQPSAKRFVVHPNTNFDQSISRPASPPSDSEELKDIRHAQNLNISSSPIDSSVPHRVIQTIIRGDFARMQEEANEGIRRLRTYLVATDLSGEAAYALEWTIGTVLRDGDTLLAVYAVDEEVGTGVTADSLPIGEGAKAMQDTTAVMERMTVASQKGSLMAPLSIAAFRPGSKKSSAANSADSRALSKAEQERSHAIEKLSETCLKFLRKTKLQVRIAIEVIHCKSPRYMITEAVSPLP